MIILIVDFRVEVRLNKWVFIYIYGVIFFGDWIKLVLVFNVKYCKDFRFNGIRVGHKVVIIIDMI